MLLVIALALSVAAILAFTREYTNSGLVQDKVIFELETTVPTMFSPPKKFTSFSFNVYNSLSSTTNLFH